MIHHETIIRTGITCKKISCYMRNSACRWLIVVNAKIFGSYVEHFSIFPRTKNCRTLIGLCKKVFMNYPIMFLDRDNKPKLVPASFLLCITFMSGKQTLSACIIKKLLKLFYLHCSCKKVLRKSNKENLKVIKNTLPNKSGYPENLKIIITVAKLFS